MLLAHATWEEVEAFVDGARLVVRPGVVIPIGSTEQHGPQGLIGTDAMCAEVIGARLAASPDVVVGPTIAFGVAQFNLGFPGTVSVRATTLMALVTDYVNSLARHGFERFYFLNGHGGNLAPLAAAFQDLYAAWSLERQGGTPILCRVRNWWDYPAVDAYRKERWGAWEGMHATPSEVSITQFAVPGSERPRELAKPEQLSAEFLREHAGDNHPDAASHRRRFPDGRVGSDSSLATAADGERLVGLAADAALADYRAFVGQT